MAAGGVGSAGVGIVAAQVVGDGIDHALRNLRSAGAVEEDGGMAVDGLGERGELAHLPPSADFVFFLFHIPLISDLQTAFMLGIPAPDILELRHYLEAQAAKSHAKFVIFNGHIHNYERFELNGITHLITGGGGARPYPVFIRGDQDLYRARTYPNFHYLLITLQGKHADVKMYRIVDPDAAQKSVEVKDSFTLDAK